MAEHSSRAVDRGARRRLRLFTLTRSRDSERGQSIVEFALSVPILLFLLLGLVDVGNGINAYLTVNAAARDGSRLGARGNVTDSTILTMVAKETTKLAGGIPTGSETIATCTSNTAGVCIQGASDVYNVTVPGLTPSTTTKAVFVKVCYGQSLLINFAGVIPSPLPICSTTVLRKAL